MVLHRYSIGFSLFCPFAPSGCSAALGCFHRAPAWFLYQFPKRSGGILDTPLTPSLSPSKGERGAEGRRRGMPANPLIVIGKGHYSVGSTVLQRKSEPSK